ncbi:hypothetical protein [Methanosarcina mazei]|nr:hypothetical protein [Methanosarcina mazei]
MSLVVAGCTDSKMIPQPAIPEKAPTVEQPTPALTTEQTTPSSTAKQPTPPTGQNKPIPAAGGNLTIHFRDVGQGDSILLEHGDDTILIDSGEIGKGDDVSKERRYYVS